MAKSYSDVVNKITDLLSDSNFSSNRMAEVLRAVQGATERVNIGDTREKEAPNQMVGYDFQRETADVNFDTDYVNYTIASSLSLKFATDLRIKTTNDIPFTFVRPEYFFRKKGVFSSVEKMFTVTYESGVRILKINHTTTTTLEMDYFSDFMWLDADGTTRKENTSDGESNDTLLIPDRFWQCIAYLAAADLASQHYNDKSTIPKMLEQQGVRILRMMMESIGTIMRDPATKPKIKSEWSYPLTRLNNN